jgi:hypothetical protein
VDSKRPCKVLYDDMANFAITGTLCIASALGMQGNHRRASSFTTLDSQTQH